MLGIAKDINGIWKQDEQVNCAAVSQLDDRLQVNMKTRRVEKPKCESLIWNMRD